MTEAKWLVLGSGQSGKSSARHLIEHGNDVTLSDPNISEQDRLDLTRHGIVVDRSPQDGDLIRRMGANHLLPSPGIPPSHPVIVSCLGQVTSVYTDVDLALQNYSGTVVAVTGTNGKSTCTAMISHLMSGVLQQRIVACGNIGLPILEALKRPPPEGVVVELSSYQLHYSHAIKADAVLLTSFSPDHLSWHGSLESYFLSKWRVIQANDDECLMYADQSFMAAAKKFGQSWPADKPDFIVGKAGVPASLATALPQLRTKHDLINAWSAANLVADLCKKDVSDCIDALKDFTTLPHRFEQFGSANGFAVINDSKATNVEATCLSLASLPEVGTLLLGGLGKGESFAPLLQYSDRINRVIAFGEAAKMIVDDLGTRINVIERDTLDEALNSFEPDWLDGPVLLSPACASFDEFKNFEHRGETFKRRIARWKNYRPLKPPTFRTEPR